MTQPSPKLPLSVCVIAHNEAHRIRACLDSVKDLAQEIILVYNDCNDGTEVIARDEYGAQIFEETWHGHRDQKAIALAKATQPWVFCIDCDEVLSDTLIASVRAFVEADDSHYNGAYFPRKVWFLGRWITHGDWYPDHSLRLIRNGKGHWGGSREHDKIILEGKAKKLAGDMFHYTSPTLNDNLLKVPYFSDIFLNRLIDRGARWSAANAIFRAWWRFFRCYFLRRGFLDGYPGFYIAVFQGYSTLFRYSRLYEHLTQSDQDNAQPPS